jgi:SAM-dependent methyltransferase
MVNYDAFAATFSKSRQDHPWPELDYIISDIRARGYTSVFDIGCGNGRFIEQMTDENWQMRTEKIKYLGIDNSALMIEEARKLHPGYEFLIYDMTEIQDSRFKTQKFDAIVFLASFHHLELREERFQVLHDVKKFLAPWGRIYMTNWNLSGQEKYRKSHRWDGDYDIQIGKYSRYYHGFTIDELAELFVDAGYVIEQNRVFEWGRNVVSIIY